MKKRAWTLFVPVCMILLALSACSKGSYVVLVGNETTEANEKAMVYESFSGHKSYEVKVEEGEALAIQVSIVTDKGNISAYIAKDNDVKQAVYQGTNLPTSDFTVNLTESGTYTIRVDAEKHSGSYSFTW